MVNNSVACTAASENMLGHCHQVERPTIIAPATPVYLYTGLKDTVDGLILRATGIGILELLTFHEVRASLCLIRNSEDISLTVPMTRFKFQLHC